MTKNHEFTSQATGKPVKISAAPFEAAIELHDAVLAEAAGIDLTASLEIFKGRSLKEVDVAEMVPFISGKLIPFAMKFLASKRVKSCLFACLEKCTYDNEKITAKTFDDYEARAAFYEIASECLKVNLSPFFSGALFVLKPLADLMSKSGDQKPK